MLRSSLSPVQATKNCLDAGKAAGAAHFILLSAICVQKPLLEFQKAKLKFESDLVATEGMTHSIVRPTAFFKSIAGQVLVHIRRTACMPDGGAGLLVSTALPCSNNASGRLILSPSCYAILGQPCGCKSR